jgi:hypothetical protein
LLLDQIPNIADQLTLAFVWHTLWETVLNRGLDGSLLLDASVALLADDLNPVTRSLILDRLPALYWLFTESDAPRLSRLESVLFGALESSSAGDSHKPIFDALIKIVSSSAGLERLASLHTAAANCDDARDRGRIALTLALRGHDGGILSAELQRVTRAADKAWLECLAPTVDPDPDERQRAFARICSQVGELPEPWLIDAITLLHDPCRTAESVSLIRPGLDMLPGLRAVGGIFLPQRWANGLLSGHGSPAAAAAVRAFLAASDKPGAIERMTLQGADLLFRAAARHR